MADMSINYDIKNFLIDSELKSLRFNLASERAAYWSDDSRLRLFILTRQITIMV